MKNVLVLMSSYNGEKYIEDQIDSILNQTGCNVTLRVRDDGSTDSTCIILEKYKNEGKLTWYTGENLRPAKSFLNLISTSPKDYEYYAFADQDDVWKCNKLESAIIYLRNIAGPAIYCCNAELVDSNMKSMNQLCNNYVLHPNFTGVLLGGGIQGATMVLNNKLAINLIGKSITETIKMHDYYISSVCFAIGGTVIYDHRPFLLYRQHENNVLGVNKKIFATLKNRYEMIMNKKDMFNISETANQIIRDYGSMVPHNNKPFLKLTSEYKYSWKNRFKLITTQGIGNGRRNIAFSIKLGILLKRL